MSIRPVDLHSTDIHPTLLQSESLKLCCAARVGAEELGNVGYLNLNGLESLHLVRLRQVTVKKSWTEEQAGEGGRKERGCSAETDPLQEG